MSGVENSINANITDMFNSANNIIANDIFSNNGGNFEGYQWIAVLDKKTCLICAKLDNVIFDALPGMNIPGTKPPDMPPIHKFCRCVMTPVLKGMRDDPSQTQLNYKDWFDRQSNAIKLDILGPSRFKEYLSGRAITEFVVDGRILTLKELGISRAMRKELLDTLQKGRPPKADIDFSTEITPEQKAAYRNYLINQLKGTSGITDRQLEEWADAVMDRFDRLPLKLKHVIFHNQITISGKTLPGRRAYFDPVTNSIHLHKIRLTTTDRSLDTFFHELGHAIDFRYGSGGSFWSKNLPLRTDYTVFLEKMRVAGQLNQETINRKLRGYSRGDVSDIFRGLSGGRFTGNFGHTLDYYKTRGIINAEAFAHIISSLQSDSRKHFKQFFPKSYMDFLEWLDKLGT